MKKEIEQTIYILTMMIFFSSCIPPIQDPPPDPRSFEPPDTDLLDVGYAIKVILKIPTMRDQLSVNKDFSLISEILDREDIDPEIKAILSDEIPDTFFAPTNEAIISFIDNKPAWETIEDIPAESLNEIIRNHLLKNENIVMNGFKEDISLTLSNSNIITIKIDYPKWSIMQGNRKIANISIKDIQGVDGIIHQIDKVLIPSDLDQ